ncbi:hypothetical protein [Planktothrix phage Pra-JY27]|nr:hypothetical protein [Planktothrix phage Pag-Yong1]WEV89222.1 hypothetical protein [Synechococcus phage MinM2]
MIYLKAITIAAVAGFGWSIGTMAIGAAGKAVSDFRIDSILAQPSCRVEGGPK